MEETAARSCWSVAAWAIGAFCLALAVGFLFTDAEHREAELALPQATASR
ncbi:hypothetical protein [Antarcticirhabdus aurantiaca]|uniref:Uncharacterized protein n=1 Tax=Antarcticirhabdus aurantiaca TaxID=2606717 RepID=A0ACD4NV93_9HYPH|nr:hypothetical protein [Antarcticirhabdus aurantiaca]WAJ30856.1 hypothetical protein OXU80_11905 [Jeongeuplla avenae]